MTLTLSGHAVLPSTSPLLRTATVPGTRIRLTCHADALPLFVDLAKLLGANVAPLDKNTWSYANRAARLGHGMSDHSAGMACDFWSGTIGAQTWPTRMSTTQQKAMAAVLERYVTADGRHVFGWGAVQDFYTGPHYTKPAYNDPMHVYVAPGITTADLRRVAAAKHLAADGTWLGAV